MWQCVLLLVLELSLYAEVPGLHGTDGTDSQRLPRRLSEVQRCSTSGDTSPIADCPWTRCSKASASGARWPTSKS
jgi:hypothetical protein